MEEKKPLAIYFELNSELNDKVEEFNIFFDKNKSTLEDLIVFVQTYPDTYINIEFINGIHLPTLTSICKISDKVRVRATERDLTKLAELQEKGIPFFFDASIPANNYSMLDFLLQAKPTHIYLADDLWYEMDYVKDMCEKHNVKIRLILNRIPATTPDRGINPKSPIFMPALLDELSAYVDVFEFDIGSGKDPNWNLLKVLYRVWFERGAWHGELSEINKDLNMPYHCDSIMANLVRFKFYCGKNCVRRTSNHCKKCIQTLEIAETMKEKGFGFVQKREQGNAE